MGGPTAIACGKSHLMGNFLEEIAKGYAISSNYSGGGAWELLMRGIDALTTLTQEQQRPPSVSPDNNTCKGNKNAALENELTTNT